MTRQKFELEKKIYELREFIAVDKELGCGFAPPGAYDDLYSEIETMEDELAKLRHYSSASEMFNDERWILAF